MQVLALLAMISIVYVGPYSFQVAPFQDNIITLLFYDPLANGTVENLSFDLKPEFAAFPSSFYNYSIEPKNISLPFYSDKITYVNLTVRINSLVGSWTLVVKEEGGIIASIDIHLIYDIKMSVVKYKILAALLILATFVAWAFGREGVWRRSSW